MKKLLFLLPVLLVTLLSACTNYGKEKVYDGTEVYHTSQVTDAEADAVGNYLISQKFADGQPKTVQLAKSGNTYQFRMVVKDGIDKDTSYAKIAKFFISMLSAQVLNGAPAEMHFCDDHLKTLKVIVADDYGKEKIFNATSLLHSRNITDAEVNALGNYLVTAKFANGRAKSALVTKSGDTYQFKFVVRKDAEKDADYLANGKVFASDLSKDVFKGAPAEVLMCDPYFNTLVVLPMK